MMKRHAMLPWRFWVPTLLCSLGLAFLGGLFLALERRTLRLLPELDASGVLVQPARGHRVRIDRQHRAVVDAVPDVLRVLVGEAGLEHAFNGAALANFLANQFVDSRQLLRREVRFRGVASLAFGLRSLC